MKRIGVFVNRGRCPGNDSPAYVRGADKGKPDASAAVLRDIELRYLHGRRHTVLVSKKANVSLPAGLVVLIRNIGEAPQ